MTERDRSLLQILVALLCVGAFVLAVLVMASGRTGLTATRVLGTAIGLAVFSLAGATGVELARRRPDVALLGYLTVLAAVAAFAALLDMIWSYHVFEGGNPRLLGYTLLLALGGSQCSLLLSHARPDDGQAIRLLRAAALLAIGALVVMGIAEIAEQGEQVGVKPMALVALVYLLGTVLIPLLRLTGLPAQEQQNLTQ